MINPIAQQILDERKSKQDSAVTRSNVQERDAVNQDKLFTILALYLDHVVQELQEGKLNVDVKNFPTIQAVDGTVSVKNFEEINQTLDAIFAILVDSKVTLPEVQKVVGSVDVSNLPPPPDIKIPPYPKQIKAEVVSLPKYLSDKLDNIASSFASLPAPVVNVPQYIPPDISIDLESVTNKLSEVAGLLQKMSMTQEKEEPLDLSPLVTSIEQVREQIKNQKFPVPNFQSSWQHSRYMQSLDGNMTYNNASISTPDATDGLTTHRVVTYLEFSDGVNTYRQTFTYNTYGEVTNKTAWVKQ